MAKTTFLLSWKGGNGRGMGQKAKGLLALPPDWVPDFAVMAPAMVAAVEAGDPRAAIDRLSAPSRSSVEARLFKGSEHLLVRSDRASESERPGGGLTLACPASWAGLADCLQRYKREVGIIGRPIIQRAIEPGLLGVMSNGRARVANSGSWVVEGILDLQEPRTRVIRPAVGAGDAGDLKARNRSQLLRALRQACAHLGREAERYRCEWIWDGKRVWLVQADQISDPGSDAEAGRYLGQRGPRLRPAREDLAGVKSQSRKFAKLRSRAAFAELGMPLPPLKFLSAAEWIGLADRKSWLEGLLSRWSAPVVVRCDVAKGSAPFLLPTSDPEREVAKLVAFIDKSLRHLRNAGLPEKDILFLLSPLVAARVSALVLADAKAETTDIDSLWGFPDGLLNLPHDSFALRKGAVTWRDIRHKPACLLLEEGKTHRARLGKPFDWEATLRSDELRQLGAWAIALSQARKRPISLMALCRINGRRGPSACMPFHFWRAETSRSAEAQVEPVEVSVLRDPRDLRRKMEPRSTVRLELNESKDRDVDFIQKVGKWAAARELTLVFSGSLLGHTRAILERSGAVVVSPEGFEVDWSGFRAAIVVTNAGIRRVRMVPEEQCRGAIRSRDFSGLCDLSKLGPIEVVEADLPGSPAMLMDDPLPA